MMAAALQGALAAALSAFTASGIQAAEDPSKYPSQPIRMIVPFAPGGA